MPEEVRLWQINGSDSLKEIQRASLDLESRLEDWLERDITILARDLLVIGRQVPTGYGGFIDLLCIDAEGDLVVIELKRDKTPREVTAQTLDYASWIKDLDSPEILSIALKYFKGAQTLEQAYSARFGKPLSDAINENHRMMIVGAKIDASSERIVRYLSETYSVGINAATFQFFKVEGAGEILSRVFLMEPEMVVAKTGKRLPPLSLKDLEDAAVKNGVGEMYQRIVAGLPFPRHTTRTSIAFTADFEDRHGTVFSLLPLSSNADSGLAYQIYKHRIIAALGMSEERLLAILPEQRKDWIYFKDAEPDYEGYDGYFRTEVEVKRFLAGVTSVEPK